jgi:ABC-type transport system involved in multi-copper enzyme maturation permease subunit
MTALRNLLVITHLTLHEAMRRRILTAALICGAAFLALYGTGLFFIQNEVAAKENMSVMERRIMLNVLTLAGLYAASRLVVMVAVLLPVDTLSGEISSGVIQTVAAKPIRRSEIMLGKWFGHWLVMASYLVLLAGGVLALARVIVHFTPPRLEQGLPLLLLEGTLLLSVSIAGGTRLSTITNGMMAFGLVGLAFIGNWVEQIGTLADNDAARYVGTVASLIMPNEALWQLAASHMQPTMLRELGQSPFSPLSVPSTAMLWWTAGYLAMALALGLGAVRHPAR